MFYKKIDERIKVLFLIMLILFVFIILRVFYIQIFDYKKLNSFASSIWSRSLPLEADRGLILDRNGVVLADNLTTTSLVLVPGQIKDKEKTTKALAEVLGTSYDDMKKHVYKNISIERVHPEGRRLSFDVAEKISALSLDGVYLVKESKRYYPYGNLLSHTLGYVGIDNQGLSGLELKYDSYLTGKSGAIKYFSDAKGNKLNMSSSYIAPEKGLDISLTIDINIQKSIERELDNIIDMFSPDMTLAIAMNPKTGEILGISSRPDYDPNSYQKYTQEVLSRNLPVWSSYEPGSTFKIITMSSAIEEKVVDIYNDHFYDSGSVRVDGSTLRCWKSKGHGDQTFLQVLENSCNLGVTTRTFLSFGCFDTADEANNLIKYLKTKYARIMLETKKVTQGNKNIKVWTNVPLQDFSVTSEINWDVSIEEIDIQLYKKYNLSDEEIDYIQKIAVGIK